MTPALLADLAELFHVEACAADRRKDFGEGDRLEDIALELEQRAARAELGEEVA